MSGIHRVLPGSGLADAAALSLTALPGLVTEAEQDKSTRS